MTLDRIIELQTDQLNRYKALKKSCDSCIDDEVIEAQELTIEILEMCKKFGLGGITVDEYEEEVLEDE